MFCSQARSFPSLTVGGSFVLGAERQPCCVCHIIFQRLFSFSAPHSQLVGVGALFRLAQALRKRSGLANRRCRVWNGYQVLHIFEPFARGKIVRLRSQFCSQPVSPLCRKYAAFDLPIWTTDGVHPIKYG